MQKTVESLKDIEAILLAKHDIGELNEYQKNLLDDLQDLINKYDLFI